MAYPNPPSASPASVTAKRLCPQTRAGRATGREPQASRLCYETRCQAGTPDVQGETTMATAMATLGKMLIDGKWCEAENGQTLGVTNPATEETIRDVAYGGRKDC